MHDGNRNGSSGNNGNSATKHGGHHNGSNGNGNSTTLAEHNALVNTAEGKAPPPCAQETYIKPGSEFLNHIKITPWPV